MKSKLIIVCFAFSFCNNVFAQDDFIEGFVLKLEGDTLFGLINNQSQFRNSQSCVFKNKETQTTTTFSPSEIAGYRFTKNGKYYVSKKIEKFDKPLFLEYLINGKLNVFYFKDVQDVAHFYVNKDTSALKELKYTTEVIEIDGKRLQKENKPTGLLLYYTKDFPELKSDIANISQPTHKNMINLAKKYHEKTCLDQACTVYMKKRKGEVLMQINGGYTYRSLFLEYKDKAISSPTLSANFLFQQLNTNERLYFSIGLEFITSINKFTLFEQFQLGYLSIPLGIHYIHPKKGFSPYLSFSLFMPITSLFIIENYQAGISYKHKSLRFLLLAETNSIFGLVDRRFQLFGFGPKIGILFNLRK